MSDEVEVETRQIYLIPTEGPDGMQNTEVKIVFEVFFFSVWKALISRKLKGHWICPSFTFIFIFSVCRRSKIWNKFLITNLFQKTYLKKVKNPFIALVPIFTLLLTLL